MKNLTTKQKENLKAILFFSIILVVSISIHFLTAPVYR
jgi:hypothetical protein